jgi:hypothetical protein
MQQLHPVDYKRENYLKEWLAWQVIVATQLS